MHITNLHSEEPDPPLLWPGDVLDARDPFHQLFRRAAGNVQPALDGCLPPLEASQQCLLRLAAYEALAEVWETVEAGEEATMEQRAKLRLALP